ncbi:MAG: T9SS type A sorting domain-containing protein, partial [Bacteroidota bacterium]
LCWSQSNGGFENWSVNDTYAHPVVDPSDFTSSNDQFFWFLGEVQCTEVAGINGSGMRLETIVTEDGPAAGYAIWGQAPDGEEEELIFPGGFEFTDMNVAGISAALRYDIDPTSPGFIWVQFTNNGEAVAGGQDGNGNYFFEVSGTQDTWQTETFLFDPPLTEAPDNCVLAFASNDILADPATGVEGNYLEVDNITLDGTMFIVPGGTLDTWEDQGSYSTPDDWQVFYSPFDVTFEQSTDVYEGDYSIQLNTIEGSEGDTQVGVTFQGEVNDDGILATVPLIDDAESLDFWYKYEAANNDSAIVFLVLSESLDNDPEEVLAVPLIIHDTPEWTQATLDFSWALESLNPQYYALLAFSSTIPDMEGSPQVGSSLYLDAFEFILEEGACIHDPNIDNSSMILCPDESVVLSTEMWDGYQWYQQFDGIGDPIEIEGADGPTLTVDGTYAGNWIWCVTSEDGCFEATDPIYIDGYVFAPVVIASEGVSDLCEGETTELSVPGGPYNTYQWEDSGMAITGADMDVYTVEESGSYTVTVTPMECPNYELTNGVPVDIDVHPNPMPVITQNGDVLELAETYDSYQWYLDGSAINGATGSTYTVGQDGTYHVVVETEFGCEGESDEITVTIDSVNELSGKLFSYFPNPADEYINIHLANAGNATTIEVIDLVGALVYNHTTTYATLKIDVNELTSGVYFIK